MSKSGMEHFAPRSVAEARKLLRDTTCYIVLAYGLGRSLHSSRTRANKAAGAYRRQLRKTDGNWTARTHVCIEERSTRDMIEYRSGGWSITL